MRYRSVCLNAREYPLNLLSVINCTLPDHNSHLGHKNKEPEAKLGWLGLVGNRLVTDGHKKHELCVSNSSATSHGVDLA